MAVWVRSCGVRAAFIALRAVLSAGVPEKLEMLRLSVIAAATLVDGKVVMAENPATYAVGIVVDVVVLVVTDCDAGVGDATGVVATPPPPHAAIAPISRRPLSNALSGRVTISTVVPLENHEGTRPIRDVSLYLLSTP